MLGQLPDPTPEGDDACGRPRFVWAEGSAGAGPAPADAPGAVGPDGLDYEALLEALAVSGRLADPDADQEAVLADELAAAADGRMSAPDLAWAAAVAVEHMVPGPAQAGWLEVAVAAAGRLDEDGLAGIAIGAQQAASRAHAAGLAAAAQISARAAAADPRIGVEGDGRPVRVCRDAQGQIMLALMLTGYSAGAWADLGVTLAWRLPATGAALAAGVIDLDRAQAIAEATSVLSEGTARVVEAQVLPGAGRLTKPDLKDRLRHLVITADPEGAERRRQAAERHADVRLYGEVDQTATIVADKQPQIEAAAGFARLNALARARKAAGWAGPLGWHRSQVLLGLLNGTLPPTPPPDQPPPGNSPGEGGPDDRTPPSNGPGPGDTAATRAAAAPVVTAAPVAALTPPAGMTCPHPAMRTRPTTTAWTRPWTAPMRTAGGTRTRRMTTWLGPVRGRCGRSWARCRLPFAAPAQCWLMVGRCPGCWM